MPVSLQRGPEAALAAVRKGSPKEPSRQPAPLPAGRARELQHEMLAVGIPL